ncbi:hypothetical protein G5B40_06915 [Pikeienuella piscinae]|uniref:Capsule polysaccharide biosynthesis protein n=1 Tax=Pikeienuella piscinae TaxID=2748098 RepID=A0A7L5BU14_9RHOB|nr:hypothetical protein [Pikeienuella piscinae]QIE55205.1 hypothetical protein G5B40_06915 [Pikeienuella piscinae]
MTLADRFFGYWRSVARLRETRLEAEGHRERLDLLDARVEDFTRRRAAGGPFRELRLAQIAEEIALRVACSPFDLRARIAASEEMTPILTNARDVDIDGGQNENLKTLFRTNDISRRNENCSFINLITIMRTDAPTLKCLLRSYQYEIPLYYSETGFFAGFSSYMDTAAPAAFRRSLGFMIDDMGYYFDSRRPSRLERSLNDPDRRLSETERARARSQIDVIVDARITKYNQYVSARRRGLPDGGGVLVVDQKRDDASIRFGSADDATFDAMMEAAIRESGGRRVYVKTHPDNRFVEGACYAPDPRWTILDDDVQVIDAIDEADAIYTVSSQVGFEALLRGKKVVVFGLPFYAGWGLTDDRNSIPRRKVKRTIEDIFHFACNEQTLYVDPTRGEETTLENTIDRLLWMRGQFEAGVFS